MIVQDLLRPLSCFPVRRELSSGAAVVRASQINRVGFCSEARWLRGLWRFIFGLLGDFRAGTLRKSPEQPLF